MNRCIRILAILAIALTSACKSTLTDALDRTPKAVDDEALEARIARAEFILRATDEQSTFSHGESISCFSSKADQHEIERENCTYRLPSLRQLYITSERYSIGTDTVLLRVELKNLAAQTPLYRYTCVSQGGEVSLNEGGRPFGALPRPARRVLRRLLDYESGM